MQRWSWFAVRATRRCERIALHLAPTAPPQRCAAQLVLHQHTACQHNQARHATMLASQRIDWENFRRAVTLLLGPLLQAALKNLFARWHCDTTFGTCFRLLVLKPTEAALRVRHTLLRKADRQEPVCQTCGRPLGVLRDVALSSQASSSWLCSSTEVKVKVFGGTSTACLQ